MRSKNALFSLVFFICLVGGFVLSLYCGNEGKVVVWWLKNLFGSFTYICYLCIVDLREREIVKDAKLKNLFGDANKIAYLCNTILKEIY